MSPMEYDKYPPNWKDISRRHRRLAHNRCERCHAEHGTPSKTGSIVILTTHHIGVDRYHPPQPGDPQDKLDCRDVNLITLCPACHLAADREIRQLGQDYRRGPLFRELAMIALARTLMTLEH